MFLKAHDSQLIDVGYSNIFQCTCLPSTTAVHPQSSTAENYTHVSFFFKGTRLRFLDYVTSLGK